MNDVIKLKRTFIDYRLDRSANDLFFYDGRTGKFEWIQDEIIDDEMQTSIYSLDEGDYWNNEKLVKEIKEFKAYVKRQLQWNGV